jgi:hypothetical protein
MVSAVMSKNEARLELRFDGLRTAESTMDASLFGGVLESLDTIFETVMSDLGDSAPIPLRIDARVREGSIIAILEALRVQLHRGLPRDCTP